MDRSPNKMPDNLVEEFDRYWFEQLSQAELEAFRQRLEEEPETREWFEEYRLQVLTVEEAGLRKRLDEFHEDARTERKPSGVPVIALVRQYWAAAALILALAIPLWIQYSSAKEERLFNTFFVTDPGLPTVMGRSDNFQFYDAMVDFKAGDYAEAIEKWEALAQANPPNDTLDYFLGVAHLSEGHTSRAIEYLERVISDEPVAFRDDTYFYLGLSHLRRGQIDLAVKFLEQSESPIAREALDALR